MKNDNICFDEWFDGLCFALEMLGYKGNIDKSSFKTEWMDGHDPEIVAKEFFREINGN